MFRRAAESLASRPVSFHHHDAADLRGARGCDSETDVNFRKGEQLRRKWICQFAIAFFFALCCATSATAQANTTAGGFPNYIPQDCHEFDCVNLLTNAITLNAPIWSKAGLMPVSAVGSASYSMSYANSAWTPSSISTSTGAFIARAGLLGNAALVTELIAGEITTGVTCDPPNAADTTTMYDYWYLQTSDGTIHHLPLTATDSSTALTCSPLSEQVRV
jgi:hypothetical protein